MCENCMVVLEPKNQALVEGLDLYADYKISIDKRLEYCVYL